MGEQDKVFRRDLLFYVIGKLAGQDPKVHLHLRFNKRLRNIDLLRQRFILVMCACRDELIAEASRLSTHDLMPDVRIPAPAEVYCGVKIESVSIYDREYNFVYAVGVCEHCGTTYVLHAVDGIADTKDSRIVEWLHGEPEPWIVPVAARPERSLVDSRGRDVDEDDDGAWDEAPAYSRQ
jgi:hypothetical protein